MIQWYYIIPLFYLFVVCLSMYSEDGFDSTYMNISILENEINALRYKISSLTTTFLVIYSLTLILLGRNGVYFVIRQAVK